METRFKSQIKGVLAVTKKLVSCTLHIPTVEASDAIVARLL